MIIFTLLTCTISKLTEIRFYDSTFDPVEGLTYAVIAARFNGKWILVRHNERMTWEIPGGHIEESESPDEAARRELIEETGAEEFTLLCVATYSVEKKGYIGYGRLYFAEIIRLGKLSVNSEIIEIELMDDLPGNLTYSDIQPILFRKVLELRGLI